MSSHVYARFMWRELCLTPQTFLLYRSSEDALAVLIQQGYVRESEGLCQLTQQGVRSLQLTQVLVQPRSLLSLEEDKPPNT